MYGDYTSTKDAIVATISEEEWFLQPEDENFMLTELIVGQYVKLANYCSVIHSPELCVCSYNFNSVLYFTGGTEYFKKCMNDQDNRIETMRFSVKGT